MIKACKDHLRAALIAAGLEDKRIYPTESAKSAFQIVPSTLFLEVKEKIETYRRRAKYEDDLVALTRTWRYQIFKRTLIIPLVVATRTEDELESVYTSFLSNLSRRVFDSSGNAILISINDDVQGIVDESLLAGKEGKMLEITFNGGVYRDKVVPLYTSDQMIFEPEMEGN